MTTDEPTSKKIPATAKARGAAPKPINEGWWTTLKLSVATFLVIAAFLAGQMAAGRDPMLGAGRDQAEPAGATVRERVIVRRKVIEELPPEDYSDAAGDWSSDQYASDGGSAPTYAAPTTSAS